jgi:DNA-binding NarL/FixJ family response regulator
MSVLSIPAAAPEENWKAARLRLLIERIRVRRTAALAPPRRRSPGANSRRAGGERRAKKSRPVPALRSEKPKPSLQPKKPKADPLAPSSRQSEVLSLFLAKALSNGEIAAALGISVRTVKDHFKRLFEKSGSKDRIHLLIHYLAASAGAAEIDRPMPQSQVLPLLAKGLDNEEIAAALGISTDTAKYRVKKLLKECGAKDREQWLLWHFRGVPDGRQEHLLDPAGLDDGGLSPSQL